MRDWITKTEPSSLQSLIERLKIAMTMDYKKKEKKNHNSYNFQSQSFWLN